MTSEWAKKKREEKKRRILAVKALELKPWELVSDDISGVFRAHPSILDARNKRYQFLRRATPEERAKYVTKEEEMRIARRIARNYNAMLSLGIERLRTINRWLEETNSTQEEKQ